MLNILLAFGAVMAFAFALHTLFDIKSGITPLLALCAMILTGVIFAMADLLQAGVVISLLAAYGSFAFAVYKNRGDIRTKAVSFFSAPVILFCASSGLMLVFRAVRQPMMSSWDEFSFWGMARKLVKERKAIYTFYSSSMLGNSIPPAMPVLCYIFQRFTPQFCEWACFFAYDVLLFACMAAAARNSLFLLTLRPLFPSVFSIVQSGSKPVNTARICPQIPCFPPPLPKPIPISALIFP